jgi:hypothetical protein
LPGGGVDIHPGSVRLVGLGTPLPTHKVQISFQALPNVLNSNPLTVKLWACLNLNNVNDATCPVFVSTLPSGQTSMIFDQLPAQGAFYEVSVSGHDDSRYDLLMDGCKNCYDHPVAGYSRNPRSPLDNLINTLRLGDDLGTFVDVSVVVVPKGAAFQIETEDAKTSPQVSRVKTFWDGVEYSWKKLISFITPIANAFGFKNTWSGCDVPSMFIDSTISIPNTLINNNGNRTSLLQVVQGKWNAAGSGARMGALIPTPSSYEFPKGVNDNKSVIGIAPANFVYDCEASPNGCTMGARGAVGTTITWKIGGVPVSKDILINADKMNVTAGGSEEPYKKLFQNLFLHEYGHYLGLVDLNDLSMSPLPIMYKTVQTPDWLQNYKELTPDDRQGITEAFVGKCP